jgi:aspartate 4-decarboxylase
VIGIHQDNIFDELLSALPERDQAALRTRYTSPTPPNPTACGSSIASSPTAATWRRIRRRGCELPPQAQMTLFALFALLDQNDRYQRRCRQIVHELGGGVLLRPVGVRAGHRSCSMVPSITLGSRIS